MRPLWQTPRTLSSERHFRRRSGCGLFGGGRACWGRADVRSFIAFGFFIFGTGSSPSGFGVLLDFLSGTGRLPEVLLSSAYELGSVNALGSVDMLGPINALGFVAAGTLGFGLRCFLGGAHSHASTPLADIRKWISSQPPTQSERWRSFSEYSGQVVSRFRPETLRVSQTPPERFPFLFATP